MTTGIALLGYGAMGRAHGMGYRDLVFHYGLRADAVKIIGVATTRMESAQQAAAELGCEIATTDWRALIARDDVQVVDICTPHDAHEAQVIAAAQAGKHIYCEKPLARNLDEARRMGYLAEGIDLDTNAVAYAKQNGRAVSRAALEVWGGGYDVICLAHTLEHIPGPVEFLAACASRLNPGGRIVVQVPCFTGLHPRLFRLRWYGWVPRQHYFHYSVTAMNCLFSKVGLETLGIWQESMDHRLPPGMRRREKPLALLSYWVALMGGAIGLGDQLVGIARVRTNT